MSVVLGLGAAWADTPPPDETLLGDMGGLRPRLERAGLTLGLQETSQLTRLVSGGLQGGSAYTGLTQLALAGDGDKAWGWSGGSFYLSAVNIHGRRASFTQDNVGGLQTVSNIEARPATRLWELWGQQSWADGKADLRVGKLAADQEFMTSEYASSLLNAMFGWAALPSTDLPAGGPAYPLASLGARLRVQTGDRVTLLAGVFDGSPVGRDEEQPAWIDRHGMRFVPVGQALLIAELQYQRPTDADGLPGTYKIGAWAHTGRFDDQRLDGAGGSLADLTGNGAALQHRGNHSLYAMADQMLWRQGARSLGVFARAMAAPRDRNRVDFSANAGVAFNGPFEQRAADVLALGVGWAHLSRCACEPGRGSETFVEASYRYPIKPWWQVQADLQYVIRPGGLGATRRVPNALMFGLRTSIVF
ncbi:MAG TPA: carbohydrate porin [Ottowia sp.]|nr:carbohydrate porin [Ottowia sp.]